jgi:hypothetical protein
MRAVGMDPWLLADGVLGKPRHGHDLAASATTKPAPATRDRRRDGDAEAAGAAELGGVVGEEYCVLAMHTGVSAEPDDLEVRDRLARRWR